MASRKNSLSDEQRRRIMQAVRGKDTKVEMVVRRLVYGLGYRYRLHRRDLPGSPDLVFGPRRKVIFVHGCFWHLHQKQGCRIAHLPGSRHEYWKAKLERNAARDDRQVQELEAAGWGVLTLWECEIREEPEALTARVRAFLDVAKLE